MTGTHDTLLVFLSVLVAAFSSFTALSLAVRIRAAEGGSRRLWIGAAALALGGGIWSMHFVAMLAFSMPGMEMGYDLPLTLISLAIALIFTGAGFEVMNWDSMSAKRVAAAGLLMGSGVLAMHYLGMAAMRMAATLSYERMWFSISVLIAIGAATAAVWLAARDRKLPHRLLAAGVMGLAIAGMHYAGMRAAVFTMSGTVDMASGEASVGQAYLAYLITGVTVVILLLALGAARLERIIQGFARREARTAFRLSIADILRAQNTDDALREVAELTGRHFGVARAGYGLLDPVDDVFDYDVCWTDGTVPPLLGRYPAAAFGVKIVEALKAGRTIAIDDILESDLSDETWTRETAREVDTRAILVVPFVRGGQLRTIIYLNNRNPRRWHREDITFMEEIAERTRLVIERAAVEEQLRDLNATLEARVEARTLELREAQHALLQSQKMEAVGQLVSGLSHDFNNVLGAIVGAFDLIRRRPDDRERVCRYAEAGLQAADRGTKLTGQLLAFSRSQRIQVQPLLVRDIIESSRDLLARTIGPMNILDLDLDCGELAVLADPTQLEMMLLNLAINARDAMPDGGRLRISAVARAIAGDRELADGAYVEIAVSDTGTGMDEETRRRAMEPFFTTKPVGKGTGLGLAQIYGSTRQAGGTVRIESAPGAGTTVSVLLPCTDERPAGSAAPAAQGESVAPRTARVLLVDDDQDLRTVLTNALDELGYSVTEAADGATALTTLEESTPDVAILDFAMPGMNGAELARRIGERWPNLPIIFASGYSDTDAIAAVGGLPTMLHKPFRIEDLVEAIERALGQPALI